MDISKLLFYGFLSLTFLFGMANQWLEKNWLFVAEVIPCSLMILFSFLERQDTLWIFASLSALGALWISVFYLYKRKRVLFLFQELCFFAAGFLLFWYGHCHETYFLSSLHFIALSIVLGYVKFKHSSSVLAVFYMFCALVTAAAYMVSDESGFLCASFLLLEFSMVFFKSRPVG